MEGAEGNSGGAADNANANAAAAGAVGGDNANNPAKRHAKVGQWRTPPVPFYGAGPPSGAGTVGGTGGVGMPGSESEYAMALQDAYQRGAASATSTSGGGGGGGDGGGGMGMGMGSHAASCPDLGSLQPILPPSGGSHGTLASVGEEEELTEEPDPQQQQQTEGYSYGHPGAPAAGSGQMMGPNGVPTPLPLGPMRIPGAPSQQSYGGSSSYNHPGAPGGNSAAHPGAPPSSSSGAIGGRGRPPSTTGRKPSSSGAGGRSVSMPDISSYAAQQDAEEAKRRKRLARNRASARLRRLKKKNLVSFMYVVIYLFMLTCLIRNGS